MREFLILACPRLSDSGEEGKVKGARKNGGGGGGRKKEKGSPLSSPQSPLYFRVSAFSIQLTRTTRSLEQANIRHILK